MLLISQWQQWKRGQRRTRRKVVNGSFPRRPISGLMRQALLRYLKGGSGGGSLAVAIIAG